MARFYSPLADGSQGIPGPTGPQGETGPAPWTLVGAYDNGADYTYGDAVTYEGGFYYRTGNPNNPGYPPTPGSINASWTPVADRGEQGIQGESGTSGLETWNRYSPTFAATGLTFTGSGATYPTYNSYYVKAGRLVSFVIEVNCTTVTNFGTGQYKLQLPFTPAVGFNHFTGWANVDTAVNPDVADGHVILNVDHAGITDILDIHYLKQSGGAKTAIIEGLFLQDTPVTLTTSSKIYVNGTYISAT